MRDSIRRFAEELESRMKEDDEESSSHYLVARLEEEFEELSEGTNYYKKKSKEELLEKSARMGLYIFLLYNNFKCLKSKKKGIVVNINDGDSADVVADKVEKAIGEEMVVREGYQQKGGVNNKPKSKSPPPPKGQRSILK